MSATVAQTRASVLIPNPFPHAVSPNFKLYTYLLNPHYLHSVKQHGK